MKEDTLLKLTIGLFLGLALTLALGSFGISRIYSGKESRYEPVAEPVDNFRMEKDGDLYSCREVHGEVSCLRTGPKN